MIKRRLLGLGAAIVLTAASVNTAFASVVINTTDSAATETVKKPKRAAKLTKTEDTATAGNVTALENCGAYLFEWRPIDCGNGYYFAILVGGNRIQESNVILNRGYDYAYTFSNQYSRPWGEVPALVNADGVWAIPENQPSLPEGIQPTLRITLLTNNNILPTKERHIDVVYLPGGVNTSELPPEVRKYLINVDGSDAGAYNDTVTPGWQEEEDGTYRYLKPDGNYVTNGWMKLNDEEYYMDENGIMLTDTITPDGYYVTKSGTKSQYLPGWSEDEKGKRYVGKNGYYAASTWVEDDGKYYYFDMSGYMRTDYVTPDGYYVGLDGVWDGNPSTQSAGSDPGPGGYAEPEAAAYWEEIDGSWKYKEADGSYAANTWRQGEDGSWYYLGENGVMLTSQTTPDGYYVDENGVWNDGAAENAENTDISPEAES